MRVIQYLSIGLVERPIGVTLTREGWSPGIEKVRALMPRIIWFKRKM